MGLVRKVKKLLTLPQSFVKGEKQEAYIIDYLKQWNNKLQEDSVGNLYYIQKGLPLICAHMDTRQEESDNTKINTIKLKGGIIKGDGCIIGGDDKVGIAIAMQAWEDTKGKVSLLFTVNEESGMNGSRTFEFKHNELLRDAPYCIIPDRYGSSDVIGNKNGYCSQEFENDLLHIVGDFGFKSAYGFSCDANILSDSINCVNMSCGYYGHHTVKEYINVGEMEISYWAILTIVQDMVVRDWPLYTKPVYNRNDYNKNKKKNKYKQESLLDTAKTHSCYLIGNTLHVAADTEVYDDETKVVQYLRRGKYSLNDLLPKLENAKEESYPKPSCLKRYQNGIRENGGDDYGDDFNRGDHGRRGY